MALDYKLIGERIKSVRKSRGYTQNKMAKELGLSAAYVSRVERGSGKINLQRLAQVSQVLNVPLSKLLTGTVEKSDEYLNQEFKETLSKCTPEKQKAIFKISKIIAKLKV